MRKEKGKKVLSKHTEALVFLLKEQGRAAISPQTSALSHNYAEEVQKEAEDLPEEPEEEKELESLKEAMKIPTQGTSIIDDQGKVKT